MAELLAILWGRAGTKGFPRRVPRLRGIRTAFVREIRDER